MLQYPHHLFIFCSEMAPVALTTGNLYGFLPKEYVTRNRATTNFVLAVLLTHAGRKLQTINHIFSSSLVFPMLSKTIIKGFQVFALKEIKKEITISRFREIYELLNYCKVGQMYQKHFQNYNFQFSCFSTKIQR